MDKMNPPITETEMEVHKVIAKRQILGRTRYGHGITFDIKKTPVEWVKEAIEECADQLQYLVALKLMLEEGRKNERYKS